MRTCYLTTRGPRLAAWFFLALLVLAGCSMTPRPCWESLKGEGFSGWSETTGAGMRGTAKSAQPSGFFTDRRSDQIEQDLGGGF